MVSQAGRDSSHQRNGLLAKNLPNGTTRWYKDVTREVKLQDESLDLVMPNVTCSDSGVYLCFLAAPVGQQNQEGKVLLTLPGKNKSPHGEVGYCGFQIRTVLDRKISTCVNRYGLKLYAKPQLAFNPF